MSSTIRQSVVIETPCIRVCAIDPAAQRCAGCHRSLQEIAGWSRMTDSERRAIMAELPGRAPVRSNGIVPAGAVPAGPAPDQG